MIATDVSLVEEAQRVLAENWTGRSTKPSPHLYPHQWNWDSGFIAIGYARYAQERAQQELTTLLSAQWSNGLVPQIVFNPTALGGYFPEPDFWKCEASPHYPASVLTSGITMPPVHAIAAARILEHAADGESVRAWLERVYPQLFALHAYLYRERDPNREGLVYIRHPWESGLDNSPVWDAPLKAISIDRRALPKYQRRDLSKGVPASQRPTDDDYDRYVYLVDLFRRAGYQEDRIYKDCPFLIQDPLFNSILSWANESLAVIAEYLGRDAGAVRDWTEQTNHAIRTKLWHAKHGAYDVFDMVRGQRVGTLTAAGFAPLITGAPTAEQTRRLYEFLDTASFCALHEAKCFSIPSYNLKAASADTVNYWRGPVWINMNWLLAHGLARHGFRDKARQVREDILELVRRWGFHEYFDPYEGTGYGSDNFSWSASLFLDTAYEEGMQAR